MRSKTLATTLAVAGLVLAPLGIHAQTFGFASDADFLVWQDAWSFEKAFGANMRWGNNALNGDWELAIVDGFDSPLAQRQFQYDGAAGFMFMYDPSLGAFQVDGTGMIAHVGPVDPVTHILARARNSNPEWDQQVGFSGLSDFQISTLDGQFLYDGSVTGDPDAQYWGVSDDRLADGFVIRGSFTLTDYDGARGSDPMAQFKFGSVSVPEPGSMLLLASGLLGLGAAGVRRRREV